MQNGLSWNQGAAKGGSQNMEHQSIALLCWQADDGGTGMQHGWGAQMCVMNGASVWAGLSLAPLGPLPCCLPSCHHEHCDAGVLVRRRLQHRKGEEVRRRRRDPGWLPSMQLMSTAGGNQALAYEAEKKQALGR